MLRIGGIRRIMKIMLCLSVWDYWTSREGIAEMDRASEATQRANTLCFTRLAERGDKAKGRESIYGTDHLEHGKRANVVQVWKTYKALFKAKAQSKKRETHRHWGFDSDRQEESIYLALATTDLQLNDPVTIQCQCIKMYRCATSDTWHIPCRNAQSVLVAIHLFYSVSSLTLPSLQTNQDICHWWPSGYSRRLGDMKCTVMIWRSRVRTPVGSNLGCVVHLSQVVLEPNLTVCWVVCLTLLHISSTGNWIHDL